LPSNGQAPPCPAKKIDLTKYEVDQMDLHASDLERGGQGYPFSVASLNYNHPLVRKVNVG